jgi:hypothetical protein
MRTHRFVCAAAVLLGTGVGAEVPTPKSHFGFDMGQDYHLADYTQMSRYWDRLANASARVKVQDFGKTEEGRTMRMLIITDPENHRQLEKFRTISERLARAKGVDASTAQRLASQGRAVVWIDGGLHSNETLGATQLIETAYQLASRTDPETRRILRDCIVLLVPANPDGIELVGNWYMRHQNPTSRTLAGLPRLYQKYIGHDDNRDFFAVTQSETKALNRVLYRQWYPQILYNHHQTGPAGTVMFAPPFRDPFNYNVDPLVISGIDQVGSAMMSRFLRENRPGVTVRSGARYSTWWNGGLRTTAYFHNIIGLLTETIGSPNPISIPLVPRNQIPRADLPLPIAPQKWHMRQSVEYSLTANWAVLDFASRHREELLLNIWRMGTNAIRRGSSDSWTFSPHRNPVRADRKETVPLHRPEARDARAYVIPSSQPDFLTALKFVNTLIENGIEVYQSNRECSIQGRSYPPGSVLVPCAQAFRAHVVDMFEPQDHPDDFATPGGPPVPPYDIAGWTLAYQMGVQFDRIVGDWTHPAEMRPIQSIDPGLFGKIVGVPQQAGGWLFSGVQNVSYTAANRLLAAGKQVFRVTAKSGEAEAGDFYAADEEGTRTLLQRLSAELGVSFRASAPPQNTSPLPQRVRVGLWDTYGGSMPSGWTRWILEKHSFPFQNVYFPRLDAGDLRRDFDLLLFVDGAIPSGLPPVENSEAPPPPPPPIAEESDIPAEYRGRRGRYSQEKTLRSLREFLEQGGTILTIGSSTSLARQLGLPVANHLVEPGTGRPLPREKFYVPGSVLRAHVDTTHPLAWGLGRGTAAEGFRGNIDVMFVQSPVMRITNEASDARVFGTFVDEKPLRSGWAWGQKALQGGVAFAEFKVGKGSLITYGPEILFRAQPHATFKLLFNAILRTSAP